ncbi:hypothetical protein DPMN_132244 [Dreissena polymorpha]|uniref:Uncharacterized protein n=1 Tax=Dreissena polymorpha TaxID=45954 RepID=A0A9D4FXY7_DREPO|nr:hypothetical protein DPMN_132244 [Dreissena polymorpha]
MGYLDSDGTGGKEIANTLEENNVRNFTSNPSDSLFKCEGDHGGWVIYVLSKAALEDHVFSVQIMCSLHTDVDERKQRVMIVLIDLQICNVPECMQWVRFFHVTKDKAYLNGILRTVSVKIAF